MWYCTAAVFGDREFVAENRKVNLHILERRFFNVSAALTETQHLESGLEYSGCSGLKGIQFIQCSKEK